MKFMGNNFMLHSDTAKELFFDYAKDMPIIDYHCHLNPAEVAENKRFSNLTELWLGGDHYKWRAMRSCGIEERLITGTASDKEKFMAWAGCMPYLIGNPLYHWTHLELQRFFDIKEPLTADTAEDIWERANEQIADPAFCVQNIFKKFDVRFVGTTDDPTDSLKYHQKYAKAGAKTVMAPSFRPDKGIHIEKPEFRGWVEKLSKAADMPVETYQDFLDALSARMDFFHENGCRIADCGIETPPFTSHAKEQAAEAFKKGLAGEPLSRQETEQYKTDLMVFLGTEFAKRGWTMQLHMNALRNNNFKMLQKLGPDTGYDSIYDGQVARNLSALLDEMNRQDLLPKTILYSLNPKDNFVLGTMLGNFQNADAKSKLQLGSGWWFNDQRDGMEEQLKALGNLGVLSYFVGMLTDSRSFLSYPRHEYFRRILCNLIGGWVENGEYPYDKKMLKKIIKGICYDNAKEYFGILKG